MAAIACSLFAAGCGSADSDEAEPASTLAEATTTQAATATSTSIASTTTATVEENADEDGSNSAGGGTDDEDGAGETSPPPDQLDLPETPAGLAAAIGEAELALRQPGIDQATAAPWGRRQQALYRVLGFNPAWAEEVIAATDPSVQQAVTRNWEANRALLALVNSHTISDTLPAWRIETPPPADELIGYYREAEASTGVPWSILASINLIETRMGRIKGISTAGAVGPMQFLPTTWAECCDGDPTNHRDAINGAGRYLVQRGAERNLDRAIFGYNNSDYYVAAVTSFAAVLDEEPDLYYAYHAWQVYFLSTEGVFVLPEGYEQPESIAANQWLAQHPETLFPAS
ncbi:MAG: lytic transglycosylase domain-containing protein [Acidimicrobiales bacterium]